MTHAWCKDIARDAAVRAAEDGRTGPLPTLDEAIDGMFPKTDSASSTVEHENKGDGMATDGLRTEWVTLKVTHARSSVKKWNWTSIIASPYTIDGESVRVVEEPKIRARTEGESLAYSQGMSAALVIDLQSQRDAAIRERDQIRENAKADHNIAKAACDERAAAIRELDESRQIAQTFESLCLGEQARNKVLQVRVAALEAASGNSSATLTSSQAASGGGEAVIRELRDAAVCLPHCGGERLQRAIAAVEALRVDPQPSVAASGGKHATEADRVALVAKMQDCGIVIPAPAASGGGDGEPVAWGVKFPTGELIPYEHRENAELAIKAMNERIDNKVGPSCVERPVVVPLYRSPPQPRGWLTEEEREAVDAARDYFDADDHGDSECVFIARVLKQLLARSSSPEVVKPKRWDDMRSTIGDQRDAEWIAALAAADVPVKKVVLPGCSAACTQQNTVRVNKEWLAALAAAGVAVKEVG